MAFWWGFAGVGAVEGLQQYWPDCASWAIS